MEKKLLVFILVLAFLLRFYPIFIDSSLGPDPFFHARNSLEFIKNKKIPEYDKLSQLGRFYSYKPLLHFSLAFFGIFSDIKSKEGLLLLGKFLSCVFGCLAVLLIYLLLSKLNKHVALFAAFIIAIMPLHLVRTSSYLRPDSFAMLLVATALGFFFIKKDIKIPIIFSIIIPWLHSPSSIIMLYILGFILFGNLVRKKSVVKNKEKIFSFIILLLITLLSFFAFLYAVPLKYYSLNDYFNPEMVLQSGEMHYFKLIEFFMYLPFCWIFIVFAFYNLCKSKIEKNEISEIYFLWFFAALFLCLFSFRLSIHLSFPAAFIAAIGIKKIFERIKIGKDIERKAAIALFLLLGILTIFLYPHAEKFPKRETTYALNFLNRLDFGNVAAEWSYGHLITFFAEKPVLIDGYFEFSPNIKAKENASYQILTSSNCEKVTEKLEEFNLKYIFVRNKNLRIYKNGILENRCKFLNKIYENSNAAIFSYARGEFS